MWERRTESLKSTEIIVTFRTPPASPSPFPWEEWERRIESLKSAETTVTFRTPPTSPSPFPWEELEASSLLLPQELTSSLHGNDDVPCFLSELEKASSQGVHLSETVNRVTRAGNTMLHLAANSESQNILQLLTHHFPRLIPTQNMRGDTVLHVAARSHNTLFLSTVMNCYSNKEEEVGGLGLGLWRVQNAYGNTAMHEAVMRGNVGGAKRLLGADAGVAHCQNKEGKTPLYMAVESGNDEIVEVLMKVPFNNREAHQGTSPIHAAILARSLGKITSHTSQPLVESWLRNEDSMKDSVLECESEGTMRFEETEARGRPRSMPRTRNDCASGLLQKLVNQRPELVELKDQKGGTPLHCAASVGHVKAARIIVNASPSSALEWNSKGYLPIHVACRKGHVNVVKELVHHPHFDPMESVNSKGQNILHIAAKRGKDKVAKYILREKKLEGLLNEQDKNGNTPLHLASKYLFPKVLLLLSQEKRVNVSVVNNEGMTARDIVMVNRKTPPTIRELLSFAILNSIGAPLSEKGRRLRRSEIEAPKSKWIKDRVSTILLVAILVATVTFAAGFTMPGGVYSSDDTDKEKRGMAALLDRKMFQLFTICDVIAMYSSTMGSFILLWAQLGDFHLALSATYFALYMVGLALVTMSVAFMAAVHLVVGNLSWLAFVVMIIGIIFLLMFVVLYILLTFPLGSRTFPLRHISNFIFRMIIPFSGSYTKFKNVKGQGEPTQEKDKDESQ